jgi:hypothetical protein
LGIVKTYDNTLLYKDLLASKFVINKKVFHHWWMKNTSINKKKFIQITAATFEWFGLKEN